MTAAGARRQGRAKAKARPRPPPRAQPGPRRAGAGKGKGKGNGGPPNGMVRWAMNAFVPKHLPMPDSTAPYAVYNLTTSFEMNTLDDKDQLCVIGLNTYYSDEFYKSAILDRIAAVFDCAGNIGTDAEAVFRSEVVGEPSLTSMIQHFSTRARLHNLSIHVICTGSTTGIQPAGEMWMGKVARIDLKNYGGLSTDSYQKKIVDPAIAVNLLKPYSARILMNGRQENATVAENVTYGEFVDFVVQPASYGLTCYDMRNGLEPVLLYLPKLSGPAPGESAPVVKYRVTICNEWCIRAPENVLVRSTQRKHAPTPHGLWETVQHHASAAASFAISNPQEVAKWGVKAMEAATALGLA